MKWFILGFIAVFLTKISLTIISINKYLYPAYLLVILITIIIKFNLNKKLYLFLFSYFLIYDLLYSSIFGITIIANTIVLILTLKLIKKIKINFLSYIFIIFLSLFIYNTTIFLFLSIIGYFNMPIINLSTEILKSTISILVFSPICYYFCLYSRKLKNKKKYKI